MVDRRRCAAAAHPGQAWPRVDHHDDRHLRSPVAGGRRVDLPDHRYGANRWHYPAGVDAVTGLQLRSGSVALDRDHVRRHRLFAGGDEFVQMLDPEPDVLADPGAADLALPDRISDPACGHVEIRRGLVDRQQRSLLRRRTRLTTHGELARPHTPERHGDNPWRSRRPRLSGVRGLAGVMSSQPRTYPLQIDLGGTVRVT